MEEIEEAPEELLEFWRAQFTSSTLVRHTRDSRETDACPSLPRFAAAAINPRLWNETETEHMQNCLYCQKALAISKRNVQHPRPFALLQWKLNSLNAGEAEYIGRHIEQDKCLHCEGLIQTSWFQIPYQIIHTNLERLDDYKETMSRIPLLLGTMTPSLSQVGLNFATESHEEYCWEVESENGAVRATVLKNEVWTPSANPGDLVILVNASEEHANRTLHIKIKNAATSGTIVEGNAVLQQREGRAVGRVNFGQFVDTLGQTREKPELEADFTNET